MTISIHQNIHFIPFSAMERCAIWKMEMPPGIKHLFLARSKNRCFKLLGFFIPHTASLHCTKKDRISFRLYPLIPWVRKRNGGKFTNSTSCCQFLLRIALFRIAVIDMALNYIWWWGLSSGALESVEYTFIAITPRSTLT